METPLVQTVSPGTGMVVLATQVGFPLLTRMDPQNPAEKGSPRGRVIDEGVAKGAVPLLSERGRRRAVGQGVFSVL